jgi:hypothetical protein
VAAKLILLAGLLVAALPAAAIMLVLPQVGAGGSISGCRALCPENVLAVTSNPSLALALFDVFRSGAIAVRVLAPGRIDGPIATSGRSAWLLRRGLHPNGAMPADAHGRSVRP